MSIRDFFSKKRFSTVQVVGLLAAVFMTVVVFSYAAVTIPNNFTANTTAKASEVNANFQALATAMPAVKRSNTSIALSTSTTTAGSISINAPCSGYVIIYVTGSYCATNTGSNYVLNLKLSTTEGDTPEFVGIQEFISPSGSTCKHLSMTKLFPIAAAGTQTYYLNAQLGAGTGNISPELTAVFFPNSL